MLVLEQTNPSHFPVFALAVPLLGDSLQILAWLTPSLTFQVWTRVSPSKQAAPSRTVALLLSSLTYQLITINLTDWLFFCLSLAPNCRRARTLFCSLLYPQYLQKCQAVLNKYVLNEKMNKWILFFTGSSPCQPHQASETNWGKRKFW